MMTFPGEERAHRAVIGLARVAIADSRGEEFEKAADGVLAGAGDRRRDDDAAGDRNGGPGCLDRDELVHGEECKITPFPLPIEPQPISGGGRASAGSSLRRWQGVRGWF